MMTNLYLCLSVSLWLRTTIVKAFRLFMFIFIFILMNPFFWDYFPSHAVTEWIQCWTRFEWSSCQSFVGGCCWINQCNVNRFNQHETRMGGKWSQCIYIFFPISAEKHVNCILYSRIKKRANIIYCELYLIKIRIAQSCAVHKNYSWEISCIVVLSFYDYIASLWGRISVCAIFVNITSTEY